MEIRKKFTTGDRVIVTADGGWRQDSLGIIVFGPEVIEGLLGEDHSYWVEFDTPQEDLTDASPYYKTDILSRYLSEISSDSRAIGYAS